LDEKVERKNKAGIGGIEMKFTHLCGGSEIPEHIKRCIEEQPARSGMYNWIFIHKGQINPYFAVKDRLEDFDQIQINMSPIDYPLIVEVAQKLKNSSTKLILNNDYVCEKWGELGWNPLQYDQAQRMGDMVFGTEPHQVSNMIDGSFCIPHATNTEVLKKLGTDHKSNSLGYIYHWWMPGTYLASRTIKQVMEKYKIDQSVLYGYKEATDPMKQWKGMMWTKINSLLAFPDFAQEIQGHRIVYDPNPCHTYGRNGVELACLKKAVVGSNRVFSYNKLMPELTCDPFDHKATLERFKLAMGGTEKMEKIMDKAYEEVDYFNYKNSKKRWNKACDIAFDRGGKEWYQKQI